jgi:hypothetical protein
MSLLNADMMLSAQVYDMTKQQSFMMRRSHHGLDLILSAPAKLR